MEIQNGFIISATTIDSQGQLKQYLSSPEGNIIYMIFLGNDKETLSAAQSADFLSGPGVCETGNMIYKVILIENWESVKEFLDEILSNIAHSHPLETLRAITYSQAHKRVINIIQKKDKIDDLFIRQAFLETPAING